MEVRNLQPPSTAVNLKGAKEFNHLRITNLEHFFSSYRCNLDYYKTPYQVLSDLEEKIKFANIPEEKIFCAYKDDGEVIFDFVGIREEENVRIVEYEFDTFIS